MVDGVAHPLYHRADGATPSTIDGYPHKKCNVMPAAGTIVAGSKYGFFGNLRISHICGILREITIDRSDHVLFESDMYVLRGIMHVDVIEADTDAIVTAKTAAA